jgi:ADP-heptose:LPS heptosyltransferase
VREDERESILIIKHSALGDIILATGAMGAIRAHHPRAHITLLTTKPYDALLQPSGWFNEIWLDTRPKWHQIGAIRRLMTQLRSRPFSVVYDLQTSSRSSMYWWLLPSPKPYFSGIAKRASHRHNTPERTSLHTLDREAQQLHIAGIDTVFPPDISWMHGKERENAFQLRTPYALLVAGGSAHRPEKRYPEAHYITLAHHLAEHGIQPVLLCGGAEASLLERIAAAAPHCLNLCNHTSFGDIADIARGASFAIGNDTGPMHIIAATGCKSVVLFSHASNPDLCAPKGEHVTVIRHENLANVSPDEVMGAAIKTYVPPVSAVRNA